MTPRLLPCAVPVPDRGDGPAELATDVHLPSGAGPWPAVLIRTPYDRGRHRREGAGWARRGVAAVVQDVRGRHASPGRWRPYLDERPDSVAVLAWLGEQPWWDGRASALGASYAAGTAWALAVEACAAGTPLRGVASLVPVLGLGPVKFEPCGVLRLAEHLSWWAEHGDGARSREGAAADLARTSPRLAWHLPVGDIPAVAAHGGPSWPGWNDVISAGPHGHPVTAADPEIAACAAAGTATLHVGGWRDLMVPDTLRHHALTTGVPGPAAGPGAGPASLVVGPWGHDLGGLTGPCGADATPLGAYLVEWVLSAVEGTAVAETRIADLTTREWTTPGRTPVSPPAVTARLHPGAGAPGRLRFVHDPADPHPWTGVGARRLHAPREDAVRWCTRPLLDGITLDGATVVDVCAAADRPADWVVRLLDEHPDGTQVLLSRGMLADLGRVDSDLTLSPVLATVRAGHRLVLEVSGADFPHAARALGTDPPDRYTGTRLQAITQDVHTGPRGTRVDLPLTHPLTSPLRLDPERDQDS